MGFFFQTICFASLLRSWKALDSPIAGLGFFDLFLVLKFLSFGFREAILGRVKSQREKGSYLCALRFASTCSRRN